MASQYKVTTIPLTQEQRMLLEELLLQAQMSLSGFVEVALYWKVHGKYPKQMPPSKSYRFSSQNSKIVTIYLSPRALQLAQRLAKQQNKSLRQTVRDALWDFLRSELKIDVHPAKSRSRGPGVGLEIDR